MNGNNLQNKKQKQNRMLRSQSLNYNQSFLIHSLFKSEQSFNNSSLHKKTKSNLLSDLNMTYSRLTQARHDLIRQPEQEIQCLDEQDVEVIFPQCPNCKKMKSVLENTQNFMLQLENKLIQKESLLYQKYQSIWSELQSATKRCQQYQNIIQNSQFSNRSAQISIRSTQIHSSRDKQNSLQNIEINKTHFSNVPKLQIRKLEHQYRIGAESSQSDKKYISTVQSSNGFQRNKKQFTSNRSDRSDRQLQNQKMKKDQIKQENDSRFFLKSTGSQLVLSQSSSERNRTSQIQIQPYSQKINNAEEIQFKKAASKNNIGRKFVYHSEKQLCKLRFENSNLKSYNEVLLAHIKPKSLASKVFNFNKN